MTTTTASADELKEFIRATLVEPPGQLNKELIKLCEGLITIDTQSKTVRVINSKVTDKEKVVLLCLGYWILSYFLDAPSVSDVTRETLEKGLAIDAKTVSAYASTLKQDMLLETTSRGTYRARLPRMLDFFRGVRKKLGLTTDQKGE